MSQLNVSWLLLAKRTSMLRKERSIIPPTSVVSALFSRLRARVIRLAIPAISNKHSPELKLVVASAISISPAGR